MRNNFIMNDCTWSPWNASNATKQLYLLWLIIFSIYTTIRVLNSISVTISVSHRQIKNFQLLKMIESKKEAVSVSERRKGQKFTKKVTWSVQLETVKMMTPDPSQSRFKFQVFSVKEEEVGSLSRKGSLWYLYTFYSLIL